MNRCSSFPNSLISIHAPPRGATRTSRRRKPEKHFNSRPSARGDTSPDTTTGRDNHISIHAPPRGATLQARRASGGLSHFNSRPSARGDEKEAEQPFLDFISIHAPPRGATVLFSLNHSSIKFQFTPLREGRPDLRRNQRGDGDFNSRPSARGDRRGNEHLDSNQYFNSRPSARGDLVLPVLPCKFGNFNSRPSARGDIKNCHTAPAIKFQFTPLREGRRARRCPARLHPLDFNSRPSARGDRRSAAASNDCHAISIHAPPRWATCGAPDTVTFRFISIHAPPRGATTKTPAGALARRISIHAPPRGATGQLGEKNQND